MVGSSVPTATVVKSIDEQMQDAADILEREENGEADPNGLDQHAPGAKLDAGKIRPDLVLGAFAKALEQVAIIGTYGADKYSDNGWLEVEDGMKRYADAASRHYLKMKQGEILDPESGLPHQAHYAWNVLAGLELTMRKND